MGSVTRGKAPDGGTWNATLDPEVARRRAMLHRDRYRSIVGAGNRARDAGRLAPNGGKDRPRLNTTLPQEALQAIDALAAAHGLQRNEVLTLAVATIAGPCADAAAGQHFAALADAWEGFAQGVQAPAGGRPRTAAVRPPKGQRTRAPGKLGPEHLEQIRRLVAQGEEAPRGRQADLARTVTCDPAAVSRMAGKIRLGVT